MLSCRGMLAYGLTMDVHDGHVVLKPKGICFI